MKNRTRRIPYCERSSWFFYLRPRTHVCSACNFTAKSSSENCPNCHAKGTMVDVGLTARTPRKSASKKKWKEFWNTWVGSHPKGCR